MTSNKSPQNTGAWSLDLTPTPRTASDCAAADEKYKKEAEQRKEYILDVAEKIETGKPLNGFEAEYIAAVLRGAANQINTKRPRKRGQPDVLPGDINFNYAVRIERGATKEEAIKGIAEEFSVSPQAVRKKLKKMGADSFLVWANVAAKK